MVVDHVFNRYLRTGGVEAVTGPDYIMKDLGILDHQVTSRCAVIYHLNVSFVRKCSDTVCRELTLHVRDNCNYFVKYFIDVLKKVHRPGED